MANDDDEAPWGRQLLVVLGVLLAVALVIGGILGAIALGAAKVTGLDQAQSRPTQKASLYIPSGKPTVGLGPASGPQGQPEHSPSASSSPSTSDSTGPKQKKSRSITLQAFPGHVSPGGRINLTGLYQGGEGSRLQVQRFEGTSWTAFPVDASVSGGQFTTYVTTSRSGQQRFRVIDPVSGKASNPVRVTVG